MAAEGDVEKKKRGARIFSSRLGLGLSMYTAVILENSCRPVCFRFYEFRLSENQDSEINHLPGESSVWISLVFGNLDYFESIL